MGDTLKPFCNSCGLCCAQVGKMVDQGKDLMKRGSRDPFAVAVARFPFKYDENGRCEKLGEDHRCTVYEDRPAICSIEKIYDKFYKPVMSRQKFYDFSEEECKRLISESSAGELSK